MARLQNVRDPFKSILNPVVQTHVVKLLDELEITYEVHTTSAPKDAGAIGVEILETTMGDEEITAVIAGGDGTAHELIEGLVQSGQKLKRWNLIILPLGTVSGLISK